MKKKLTIKKKSKTTTTVTTKEEYILSKEISYIRIITNGKITSNKLVYKGSKINGYDVSPMYKFDLSILKVWNPFWGENQELGINKNHSCFKDPKLPEPEEINLKDIILCQGASHRFYSLNREPIPVVIPGNYIEAQLHNKLYDLEKLKKHFSNHKNIVKCSEILDIPYYNTENRKNKYLDVLVYPKKEWLIEIDNRKKNSSQRDVFTSSWDKEHPDFLKTRKFMKENHEDEN